jgi:hypothetical protein
MAVVESKLVSASERPAYDEGRCGRPQPYLSVKLCFRKKETKKERINKKLEKNYSPACV